MSDALKIVFLDRGTLPSACALRRPAAGHQWHEHQKTAAAEAAARIADADIVITNKVRIDAAAMAAAPRLRFIAVAATGTDIVDLAAAKERGIVVSNIRDYARATVPEHVFALMLALRRSIIPYRASVAAGDWQKAGQFCYFDYPINDLAGATLGIVGGGALGESVARLGAAFGMNVVYAERKGADACREGRMPFGEMLATSDVISLHLPLTPESRGLIGAAEFAAMSRRPILINTARGGLVDEVALGDALRSGQIAGAGFDVASPEPPPADGPLMGLVGLPNFILTPHTAWASAEATQALADQLIDNVDAFISGAPRNRVA